jgi:hypothetical protein
VLGNSNGFRLEPPITVPTNVLRNSITITADGKVLGTLPGEVNPQEFGQIEGKSWSSGTVPVEKSDSRV